MPLFPLTTWLAYSDLAGIILLAGPTQGGVCIFVAGRTGDERNARVQQISF